MAETAVSHRRLLWIAPLVALAVLAIHNAAIQPWMLDDAFISFRFAENFAAGDGPVYNVGERVEGYTCFLWVAILALGKALGLGLIPLAKILGVAFGVATILLLAAAYRFVPRLDAQASAVAALFLGTCGIFTPWATSGMEVTLFGFLILWSVLLCASLLDRPENGDRWILLGVVGALGALTRPEGLMVLAVILCTLFVGGDAARRRRGLLTLLSFAVLYVPYYIWRLSYYGHPLPNTFYAKVGLSVDQFVRGAQYCLGAAGPGLLVLVPILWVVLFARQEIRSWPGGWSAPLLCGVFAVYIALVGGDGMPAYRFFAPLMPVLCLLAGVAVSRAVRRPRVLLGVVIVTALYNIAQMRIDAQVYEHLSNDQVAGYGKAVGLWLRSNAPRDAVIATNTAGSIPYYSGLRTIDMLGMCDAHIAHRKIAELGQGWAGHEKSDGAYVLARRPDIIIFDGGLGSVKPYLPGDRELYGHPDFQRLYSLRVIRLPQGWDLRFYERNGES